MKRLLTTTMIVMLPLTAAAGGLAPPITTVDEPPAPTTPVTITRDLNFYLRLGVGQADIDPNYSNSDVFLDYPWFKKNMPSVLVDDETDLSGDSNSYTIEAGFLAPIGDTGLLIGAYGDYTHFGYNADAICKEDAGLTKHPWWPRPDHTCFVELDNAQSAGVVVGYELTDRVTLFASAGKARAEGSQGWYGRIERRPELKVSDEDFTVDGTTYAVAADYDLSNRFAIGVEYQVFDFEEVTTRHDWGDTHTSFDTENLSLTMTMKF